MPLGSRDILLILRARNEAGGIFRDAGRLIGAMGAESRTSAQNMMLMGAGLAAVGVAFTAAGAAGISFFADATESAIEYRRQAALTVTQIDQVGVTIDDIGAIAKRVAREVPAPFEEMQTVLYDIFSSMDVTVPQAESLLKAFSKEAVAGQVGIQEAARATIAIMNAFGIPIEDVNKVLDLQFQLVRKGVGTFAEFSEVIGRVTPAAVSAGQNIESMAGMLAFLTRNGLSTAMAATSAARAMELLTKKDVTDKLKDMGVKVTDANGNFLQMRDIIRQLVYDKGWGKMTGPELKEAFKNTFGTGTIQARRFFDTVIPNFEQFSELTDAMGDSAGAMDAAYDIMFNQPAMRAQELSNRWQILKVDVGERLIPVFEKFAGVLIKLMDAWEGLSPTTQDTIIKVLALASALAVIVGVVTTVVGVVLLFVGAATLAGVSLTTVGVVIAGIVAAFVALVAIVYNVIQHWDTLVEWFNKARETFDGLSTPLKALLALLFAPIVVIGALVAAVVWLVKNFEIVKEKASEVWTTVSSVVITAFNAVKSAVETVWGWITGTAVPAIISAWNSVVDAFNTVKAKIEEFIGWVQGTAIPFVQYWVNSVIEQWNLFAAWWEEHVGPIITAIGEFIAAVGQQFGLLIDYIEAAMQFIWDIIQNVWTFIRDFVLARVNEIWTIIQAVWGFIYPYIEQTMAQIWNAIQIAWDLIQNIVKGAVDFIKWVIQNWGDNLVDFIQIVWDMIVGFIEGALQTIRGVINIVTGLISGDWGKVWEGIKNVAQGVWNMIWAVISSVIEQIANVIRAVIDGIAHFMGSSWNNIWNQVQNTWNNIKNAIGNVLDSISHSIRIAISTWFSVLGSINLWDVGKRIIGSLWDGIKSGFGMIKDGLGNLTAMLPSWKGPAAKDKRLLIQNGQYIMQGLQVGLASGWDDVRNQLMGYTPSITGMVGVGSYGPVGSYGTGAGGGAITIQEGAFVFHIDNAKQDVQREVQAGIQAAFSQLSDQWAGFGDGTP